ncbi:MAG: NAD(P)/FAD-dependent oxidoreductase [Clostridia bacterium]|nr:NAD(P)/FAD-dependent oxidoreductase [Clostridia bacterium]
MADRNVIVIGAGIAGLTAGCYLQMNGYPTTILEMGSTPGGLCTSWKRGGYTFDGCIRWLFGAVPYSPMNKYWLEVGALQDGRITRFTEYKKTEYAPGQFFSMYTDADWLSAEMLRVAPEDAKRIAEFIRTIKRAARGRIPGDKAFEICNPLDRLVILLGAAPLFRVFRRYGRMTVREYAEHFRSPVLRENLADMMGLYDDLPMALLFAMAGWMHAGGVGYPLGGSLGFARSIETHFRRLGGTVRYQSRVKRILTDKGRAIGVELESGEKKRADVVISAADGYDTLYRMLGGEYVDKESAAMFGTLNGGPHGRLFDPLIQVSIGANKLFRETAHTIRHLVDTPIRIDDTHTASALDTTIYHFDGSLAPPGKTTIVVLIRTDFEYWNRLAAEDAERYEEEKIRIGREVVRALDPGPVPPDSGEGPGGGIEPRTARIPGLAEAVEVIDVMTPVTMQRQTNNFRASFQGWFPTVDTFRRRIPKTLPGLSGFYRIGQWTVPGGGLPSVLLTGRHVAQILCRQDGRRFTIRT